MTYHRRNKKKISRKMIAIIAIVIVLFFMGSTVKEIVHWTAAPITSTKNAIIYPFKTVVDQFKFKNNLINENEALRQENRRLEIENLTVESLKKENESLKDLVNYIDSSEEFTTGKVLNKPPFSPYDTFIIDLGREHVSVGDSVHYLGALIGTIEETYVKTSVVRLKSSPGQSFFVSVLGEETEAMGIGGGGFALFLPRDFEVSEGESILVNDSPIGKIDGIESDATGAFQNIYFRYPFNINDVEFVEVISNN